MIWPEFGVGTFFRVLDMPQYACGLKLGSGRCILNPNFYFKMACRRKILFILTVVFIFFGKEAALADEAKYSEFVKKVSNEIAELKAFYPQLKQFSIQKNVDIENLRIDFSYHTHPSQHTAGWLSAVPNPDKDGIWLYIDLHDKDSTAQIHTQPVTGISLEFGNKRVCCLILQGAATQSVSEKIISILEDHGAKTEQPQ